MPLGEEAQHWLERYLAQRGRCWRAGARWRRCSSAQSGEAPSRQQFWELVKRYAAVAGIDPAQDQPAWAAPQLRHPPAQPRRRPARAADAAGPQFAVDHADLHAGRARAAQAAARQASSAGVRSRRRRSRAEVHVPVAPGHCQSDATTRRTPGRPFHPGVPQSREPIPVPARSQTAPPEGILDEAHLSSPRSARSACPPAPRPRREMAARRRRPGQRRECRCRGCAEPAGTPDARAIEAIRAAQPAGQGRPRRRGAAAGLPRGHGRRPGGLRQR